MLAKPLKSLPEPVTEEVLQLDLPYLVEDIEKRTQQYIELRDAIAKLKDKQEAEMKPFLELKELLSATIQKFMGDNNLENLKTRAGTCYLTNHYSVSVMDGELFMGLVKEGNWDLIERRANSTAVQVWVKENNALPAGVNLVVTQHLGVRRPTTKK